LKGTAGKSRPGNLTSSEREAIMKSDGLTYWKNGNLYQSAMIIIFGGGSANNQSIGP